MKLVLPILLLVSLYSCSDGQEAHDTYLPEANGQHGEILILMEDHLWNGDLGRIVADELSIRAEGRYLRPESMFSYFHRAPKEVNHLTQLNRNILKFMIDTDSSYEETAIIEKNNYYAKNQLFLIVKDSDPTRLLDFARTKMRVIIDRFNQFELTALMGQYYGKPQRGIQEIVAANYGVEISVPSDFRIEASLDSFMLIKRDRSKNVMPNDANKAEGGTFWIQQGMMFWTEPYWPDSVQMTIQNRLMNRDSTLKKFVAGTVNGTYMGTEYSEYYDPIGRTFKYQGHEATEIRGLWIYEGDTFVGGGGPFVQYSIVNEAKNEIVTISGYVYGPSFDKREYIRELDAMLSTIKLNP